MLLECVLPMRPVFLRMEYELFHVASTFAEDIKAEIIMRAQIVIC